MIGSRLAGRSILTQTFWLLVGALIVVQAVGIASLFLLPPPRQEGVALMQFVDWLQKDRVGTASAPSELKILHQGSAPPAEAGLASNAKLTGELADRLNLPAQDVRLYFRADQSGSSRSNRDGKDDGIVRWRGEPFFYDRTVVGARIGNEWRVIHTPNRPLIAAWQKYMAIVFALALLALLPLAFLFARRMVKPIRAFAEAADQVGRDASAPMVPEKGPTELRVAARAVNAMQGRIAEQIREREAMVGAIAHDLRTPLSRIAFRIEAADDALREPIQRDIDQMKAMITTTLSYVRGGSRDERHERVDLNALLEEIVANEQNVGRPVRRDGSGTGACLVRGDRVSLGRMIQNLVDNAIAYGVCADLALSCSGERLQLVIADRGPGLPAEDVEAMFAPFARAERSRNRETGGTGLGLAIARRIARDHGGEIRLRPRAGGGLEAVVDLPRAAAN